MPARRVVIDGVEVIDPRHTRAWRRLRDQVVAEEPTCRLRFPGICTLVSTTAAHIKPVVTYPELALVRSNLEGSCAECNKAAGTLPEASLVKGSAPSPALSIFRR
jgi:5-methylcytosine-specific restriction endonuclease McrA